MVVTEAKALEWVYAASDAINKDLPDEEKIVKAEDTIVHGEGSSIDSLMIINLMLAVESAVERESGTRLSLMSSDEFANGEASTLGKLAHLVAEQLQSA